jgi:hypothetical protein
LITFDAPSVEGSADFSTTAAIGAAGGIGGFVFVSFSSPKLIVVAPPGDARTRVEDLEIFMSVLIRVLIVNYVAKSVVTEKFADSLL